MMYKTTAAYISGGICGNMWMPQSMASKELHENLRGVFGRMDSFTEPATFRDCFLSCLMANGGDFQNPEFTADTVIRIERTSPNVNGKYSVHIKEIEISSLEPDLVNNDYYTSDFWQED